MTRCTFASQASRRASAALIGAPATLDGKPFDLSPWAFAPTTLLYVVYNGTKGEPRYFEYDVPYESALAERDLKFLANVNRHVRIGLDPMIPEGNKYSSYPCSWCNFRSFCWQNKNEFVPAITAAQPTAAMTGE